MSFLSALPWKLIGAIALVAVLSGLWLRGDHYQERATKFETLLDGAIEVSNANAEAARAYASEVERLNNVAAKAVEVKNGIRQSSERRQAEILAAPPGDDGPLAPVLRDQLNRLPVAAYPDAGRNLRTTADPGFFARPDAGAVPARAERDAERRRAGS